LSSVYNLIKGQHADSPQWDRFVKRDDQHDIQLHADPGNDSLSRFELSKLEEVAKRYEDLSEWAIVEITHGFKEWKDNKPPEGSSARISTDDILRALKMQSRKADLASDARGLTSVRKLLSL